MRICPICNESYAEGIEKCPDCKVLLITLMQERKENVLTENGKDKNKLQIASMDGFSGKSQEQHGNQTESKKREEFEKLYGFRNTNHTSQSIDNDYTIKGFMQGDMENWILGLIIAIAVVICIIIVLVIVFIHTKNVSRDELPDYRTRETYETDQYTEELNQEDEDTWQDDEDVIDYSLVDIDAVSNSYQYLEGVLLDRNGNVIFMLDQSYTIAIYDEDTDNNKMITGVKAIKVSTDTELNLDPYLNVCSQVEGDLSMYDGEIWYTITEIASGEVVQESMDIHQYEVIIRDCTWQDAFQDAIARGGYLVRINTKEEYYYILEQLNMEDYSKYHFYLGGRRDGDVSNYFWVDQNNDFIGEVLNQGESWTDGFWYNGEPSFEDVVPGWDDAVIEDVMNLFCVNGTWYLNDTSSDLPGNYSMLNDKIGYIVEYE